MTPAPPSMDKDVIEVIGGPDAGSHAYHLQDTKTVQASVGFGRTDTEQGVEEQRRLYGSNRLAEAHGRSLLAIIFGNFFNSLTAILAAVFVLAVVIEEWIEAVVVVLIILLNGGISVVQEYHSERSMAAIRHLGSATHATVIRGGRPVDVEINDVVVGDLVDLRMGDVVPADLRIIEANRLEVDEAALTGESVPVAKTVAALPAPTDGVDVAVGDRTNMAFRQTSVTQGSGKGIVVFVGGDTQIGAIAARLAGGKTKKTALTLTMEHLMYFLLGVGVVFAILIFWAFEFDLNDAALLYASATLVAILPEAAIVLITVTMAISTRRMAGANAIVRKMTALEQLGKVTDICSDKTGTLTEGKMRPAKLALFNTQGELVEELTPEGPALSRAGTWSPHTLTDLAAPSTTLLNDTLRAVVLCSGASLEVGYAEDDETVTQQDPDHLVGTGSPTELALLELAHKALYALGETTGLTSARTGWEARGVFEFESTTKTMSAGWFSADKNESLITVKGAPEAILKRCAVSDGGAPLAERPAIRDRLEGLAAQGLRVLAVAQRRDMDLSNPDATIITSERDDIENNLELLALVAVRDPPKASSLVAVKQCFGAGITVRMLTGDHPDTALAIAREIGIVPDTPGLPPPPGQVMTGPEMDLLSDADLDKMTDLPLIVARSSPASKVRMVEALHRRKRIVAMTGDGVNDSPAIKEADVGIAMGITGSDVTKGVADIVLADDNFATIVAAIKEGRRIFASISNFVMHLLSGNVAEAVALMVSLSFVIDDANQPVFVLSPIAILFINTATGSGPAIGLALDACAPDIMNRPPLSSGIFTKEAIVDCLFYGFLMGGLTLVAFSAYLYGAADGNLGTDCNSPEGRDCGDVKEARGDAFLTLNTLLLMHAFNCRHQRLSLFAFPIFDNTVLWGSLVGMTIVAVPLLYAPFLSDEVFKQAGVTWEWGMVAGFAVIFMCCAEFYKWVKRQVLPPLVRTVEFDTGAEPLDKVAIFDESKPAVEESASTHTSPAASAMETSPPRGTQTRITAI
eukprot:m.71056 g.71056  ORF g.71056 m.71056 type:complete len:1032 (+) comp8684_c0_seq2:226-3321(+)